jgi:hypothetical protein
MQDIAIEESQNYQSVIVSGTHGANASAAVDWFPQTRDSRALDLLVPPLCGSSLDNLGAVTLQ